MLTILQVLSIEYTFLYTEFHNRLAAESVYIRKIPTSKPRKERNRSRRAIKLVGGTTVLLFQKRPLLHSFVAAI